MKFAKIITLALMGFSTTVFAGPFTDDMSKCLVKNTTQADKEALIKWIYAAMSAHPSVKSLSNVSVKQGAALNKGAAELMIELLTQRCKIETQQAIKNEGEGAIRISFQILGQVAMQDLMTHEAVTKYISGLATSVDKNALEEAFGKKSPAAQEPAPTSEAAPEALPTQDEAVKPQEKAE